jgi:hypothetical protein
MECTQQEHDSKREKRNALEDAQRARLQRIHVAQLRVERIPQQCDAREEAKQELDAERSAEEIDHVATLAAGRMRAKTGDEGVGSAADTNGSEVPTADSISRPPKAQKLRREPELS